MFGGRSLRFSLIVKGKRCLISGSHRSADEDYSAGMISGSHRSADEDQSLPEWFKIFKEVITGIEVCYYIVPTGNSYTACPFR
jgi:hypothetical protein